jgi:NitT/TauT family transport system permease protein
MALNTWSGFMSVPETLKMTGRNYGLSGWRYVLWILIPAALPALLGAENRLGLCLADADCGGAGVWRIERQRRARVVHFQNRNEMYTDRVFAGLVMVTAIGLLVEGWYLRP